MKPKKIIAMIMTLLMMLSLFPSMVFAAATPSGELGGKLKIKGVAAVGSELSADYSKATPDGLTDDYVSFCWSRKVGDELTEVGTEKIYKLTEEDLGNKIELKVTALPEMGVSGELKANTVEIVATPEEAPQETTEDPDTVSEAVEEMPAEELPADAAEGENTVDAADPAIDGTQDSEDVIDIGKEDSYDSETDAGVSADTDTADESAISTGDSTDNDVIDIGTEDYLEIPEDGNTVTPAENAAEGDAADEFSYSAEAVIADGNEKLDFGTLEENFTDPETKEVTIKNTGTGTLNFISTSPEHFMIEDIMEPLAAGESVTVQIQPRAGIPAGEYDDTITYETEEGVTASFEASVVVTAAQTDGDASDPQIPAADDGTSQGENEDPAATPINIEIYDDAQNLVTAVDFGMITEGQPGKDFNIKNTGSQNVEFKLNTDDFNDMLDVTPTANYIAGSTPSMPTATGMKITPKDFTPGTHETTIKLINKADDTVLASIPVSYSVANPVLTADNAAPDFGSMEEGYAAAPEAKTITLTNNGNVTLSNLAVQTDGSSFTAGALSGTTVEPGQSVTFTVAPVAGLNANAYSQIFTVTSDQAPQVQITASFTVTKPAENPVLTADRTSIDFGTAEAGYAKAPGAVTVTLTNGGNVTLSGMGLQTSGNGFTVSQLSAVAADPGQQVTFTVAPASGLAAGPYSQQITVTSDKAPAVTIKVDFTVTNAVVKVTGVGKVADISVTNGVAKSAEGLKLPSTVKISTNKGDMNASVKWDVKGCAYNPNSTESQKFSVKGNVTLPDGVTNPDNLNLVVSVNITTSRGPIVSSASDNTITGISSDGAYTTETKITFTAVGAGMDITNPIKGDVRYQPLYWEVLESRSFDSAPYSATFRMGKNGSYTLTVTYNQQKFDGSNWVNTGTQDTKQVSFNVSTSPNQTLTPAADRTDANKKNAVKTGDNTPIVPFVIILVVAIVLIAGILVYRNKKK